MRSFGAMAVVWVALAACSGESSETDAANDPGSAESACDRYQAAQSVKDACAVLGGCPQTLRGYLATGHVAPQNYARVGCGLTEIRDVDAGADGSNTYDFDDTGALVGFDRVADSGGPCDTNEYVFGTLLDACDDVRECRIPADAGDTGDVCACDCPASPPDDGVLVTTPACVYPANPIADCEPELSGELARYGDAGLTLRYGCGSVVAGDPSVVQCAYDTNGALSGAFRADGQTCAGVTGFQTGEPYVGCNAELTCRWGAPDPADEQAPCSDVPPDAGGDRACSAWQDETDLAASCALVGACPADERSYLDGLDDPTTITAVIGCGLTEYDPIAGSLGGQAFVFDADGNLVGYDFWSDVAWGPCTAENTNDYQRGENLLDCAVAEACPLREDRTPACK